TQLTFALHSFVCDKNFVTGQTPLSIHIADPLVTHESISLALSHCYSSRTLQALADPNAAHLRLSVLAAAQALGMSELANILVETVESDIRHSGYHLPASSPSPAVFPASLAVFAWLCHAPSTSRHTTGFPKRGTPEWHALVSDEFAALPFEWLKRVLEHPQFCIKPDVERYRFAQAVVAKRAVLGGGVPAKESVFLAFGGASNAQNVVIRQEVVVVAAPFNHYAYPQSQIQHQQIQHQQIQQIQQQRQQQQHYQQEIWNDGGGF
ncbi:MAG: hypothetical protein SGCHY_000379, partial [Lobulomycetales sp.]